MPVSPGERQSERKTKIFTTDQPQRPHTKGEIMISAPKNIYGPDVFKIFVHELGGPKLVCKMLGVTERTVWRWLAEDSVPKMAVRALYWESRYGRSLIDTDHHTEVVLLRGHIQILQQQFARAAQVIQGLRALNYGTANEPLFDERGEFNVPDVSIAKG